MKQALITKPSYSAGFEAKIGGKKGLVPYTAPGEVWKVQHLKGDFYKPLEPLKETWKDRRVPSCGYYPLCSNCQWMHVRPQRQIGYKKLLFKKYIGVEPDEVLTSPSEFHYRVKTLLYRRGGKFGFKKSWFFDLNQPVMEISYCYLLHPLVNDVIQTLQRYKFPDNLHAVEIFVNPQSGERFVKFLFLRNTEIPERVRELIKNLPFEGKGIYKGEYLYWERVETFGVWETKLTIGGFRYKLSPDCFLQPNRYLWKDFLKLVRPLEKYKKGLELHSGMGFFTLNLSGFVSILESSDIGEENFKYRNLNLETNGIKNVQSFKLDFYKHLKFAKDFDLLVVDPPRGGLGTKAVELVLKKRPKEIIYVSCNLQSLKRDLELLRDKYKIVKTALVEQFPNTYHTESVVWLKRNA
jgi:23S rRNA (uracil1939-C5)-methyltransferase